MQRALEEWAKHLELLIDELQNGSTVPNAFPEIMLLGSPIYTPDYKVLFIMEEMKLRLSTIIHPDIEHIRLWLDADKMPISVKSLTIQYLEADISPIYIKDPTMLHLMIERLNSGRIKGVIAHILKGQVLFDYEFKTIEQLTADCKIPLNRIETVYDPGDTEQIRLRLEAFSEMLHLKR